MQNINNYDEFVNEGFFSKSFLALSLAISSLFTNIKDAKSSVAPIVASTTAARSHGSSSYTVRGNDYMEQYPAGSRLPRDRRDLNYRDSEFMRLIIKDDIDDIIRIIKALMERLDNKDISIPPNPFDTNQNLNIVKVGNNVLQLKEYLDTPGMDTQTFMVKFNSLKPQLVQLVRKYGVSNYHIEQILKHNLSTQPGRRINIYSKKDIDRAHADLGYIKKEMDNIAKKYNVTEYEKMSSGEVFIVTILALLALTLSIWIGYMIVSIFVTRRNRQRRQRREAVTRRRVIMNLQDTLPAINPIPQTTRRTTTQGRRFNQGDRVIYQKVGSKWCSLIGTFVRVRNDGKYVVEFDNGELVALPGHHVLPYKESSAKHIKEDPYMEENWEN